MRSGAMAAVVVAALAGAWLPGGVAAQAGDAESAMIAAGEWARARVPGGSLLLDPHRTGRSTERAVAARVASALGADLGTLEQARTCTDVTDPSTCGLSSAALLAIAPPAIRGDEATVRVYAWYRQDDPRAPVGKATWEVRLRRSGSSWAVVGGEHRLD